MSEHAWRRCRSPPARPRPHLPPAAATRVAREKLPVPRQIAARRILPPSSGRPGTRLKTATPRFTSASVSNTASAPVHPSRSARPAPSASTLPIATDVAGPASATANSEPGVGSSPSISATPPKQEQRDALHTDAEAPRDDGVCDLVDRQAAEEREAGDRAPSPDARRSAAPGARHRTRRSRSIRPGPSTANHETWIHSGTPTKEPSRRRKRRTHQAYGACVANPGNDLGTIREAERGRGGSPGSRRRSVGCRPYRRPRRDALARLEAFEDRAHVLAGRHVVAIDARR